MLCSYTSYFINVQQQLPVDSKVLQHHQSLTRATPLSFSVSDVKERVVT